jgi:hypothetical protein
MQRTFATVARVLAAFTRADGWADLSFLIGLAMLTVGLWRISASLALVAVGSILTFGPIVARHFADAKKTPGERQ